MSGLKDLTLPQLRQLLAEHDEHRPTFGTPEFKAWATKKEELKFWIELGQAKEDTSWKEVPPPDCELPPCPPPPAPKPAPIPMEAPMTIPKNTDPEEHLDKLLIRLAGHQSRRAYKSAFSTKIAIREWCSQHGLAVPAEAQSRVTESEAKPKAKKTAPAKVQKAKTGITEGVKRQIRKELPKVAGPEPEFVPSPYISTTGSVPDPMTSVREIRRRIWLLMADLEDMGPEERQAIEPELGLLDAAAHSAHQLALGRLEVA